MDSALTILNKSIYTLSISTHIFGFGQNVQFWTTNELSDENFQPPRINFSLKINAFFMNLKKLRELVKKGVCSKFCLVLENFFSIFLLISEIFQFFKISNLIS